MKRAAFLVALVGLVPLDGASARVVVGSIYDCGVRNAGGEHLANLTVTIRKTEDMRDARLFDARAMPLWVVVQSDGLSIPGFEMPTSEPALRDGSFRVNINLGPPVGIPPIAPSVAIRLVLDGDEPINNGYVVIYQQQPGSHFETVGVGPQGIGLCRLVRDGAPQ